MRRRRHGQRYDRRAHRLSTWRRVKRPLAIVGIGICVVAFLLTITRLPSDTGAGTLALRGAGALLAGLGLIVFVRRALRTMVAPATPPPPMVEASPADVVYVCSVCGTRVRLEVAATGKAPRHCGEEMEVSLG